MRLYALFALYKQGVCFLGKARLLYLGEPEGLMLKFHGLGVEAVNSGTAVYAQSERPDCHDRTIGLRQTGTTV